MYRFKFTYLILGTHIIVVAIGKDMNRAEIEGMANDPKSANVYRVESIRTLPSITERVINSICNGKYHPQPNIPHIINHNVMMYKVSWFQVNSR